MNKRTHIPDLYRNTKKLRPSSNYNSNSKLFTSDSSAESELPNDTEAALIYLKEKFPIDAFEGHLPAVLLIHQVYSIVKNKTKVDKEVADLQAKGKIKLFKLGGEETALVVIFTFDLINHVLKCCGNASKIDHYLKNVMTQIEDISIDKEVLRERFNLSEDDIRDLVSAGLLAMRSATSYWFSFPNAGEFMKIYLKGRKAVINTIKKSKFREILQSELEQRKLKRSEKLGMSYYIHDIMGADLVQCIETTSGNLLRVAKK